MNNTSKKSISLTLEEVELILSCLDTSLIYLHNCNSRFKLLRLYSYMKPINRGINNINVLSKKINKLYNKFDLTNSNYLDTNQSIFSLFDRLLD